MELAPLLWDKRNGKELTPFTWNSNKFLKYNRPHLSEKKQLEILSKLLNKITTNRWIKIKYEIISSWLKKYENWFFYIQHWSYPPFLLDDADEEGDKTKRADVMPPTYP